MSHYLSVSRQFSRAPATRYRSECKHSAEEFRETLLKPMLDRSVADGAILIVDLDGTYGYACSFLEESFGGLIRDGMKLKALLNHMVIKSHEDPELIADIIGYLNEASTSE